MLGRGLQRGAEPLLCLQMFPGGVPDVSDQRRVAGLEREAIWLPEDLQGGGAEALGTSCPRGLTGKQFAFQANS